MGRITYQSDDRGSLMRGPYNPAAGQRVTRSHAERTFRQILRLDGSVAATEERQTLTLDTDGPVGPLMTARQLDRLASPLWRVLYLIRDAVHYFIGALFLTVGSALVLSITNDLTHSIGWSLIAVFLFWMVCSGIASTAP